MQRIGINGVKAEYLSIMDRGLHYGDGLFETIACRQGALQLWDEHIARMKQGAGMLGIDFPGEEKYFRDIESLIDMPTDRDCIIKLLLTRGDGERGYKQPRKQKPTRAVIINHWPGHPTELVEQGIKVCLCKHPVSTNPVLAGLKHLNRLDNVLARSEWQDEFHEGFMSDVHGNIVEGTMSNIFCIKNGKLFTPGLDQCGVKGIIREQILLIAKENDFEHHIKNISLDDIHSMDEIFITNSIIGLWPVSCVGDTKYPVGELTCSFEQKLMQRMKNNAKSFA
ncbi:MAG: aminodeoxychorismate lyase [Gammaproteobacteria bacterium]|nr:aminodeoxychorismate lyase [Gammaproteobacteria bacterium]